MLINFLDPNFSPKVDCDSVSDDTHHFQNLISKNPREKELGFMSYSIAKPPATLKFTLNYKCDLDSIKIWTQLGSLKSTRIQVFIKNHKLLKIAETSLKDEVGVIFHKENSTCVREELGSFKRELFYRNSHFAIKNVTEIHICIKETLRCPPVIKKIEILGIPGKMNTSDELGQIKEILREIRGPRQPIIEPYVEQDEPEDFQEDKFEIPEEFLDQITYEICSMPMTLPCGKLVDQSTIEKHNYYEAKMGRLPYDPFTGLPYSESRKPLFNCSLKSQIDIFMLKNCNQLEIKKAGRTIGRKRKLPEPQQKHRESQNLLELNSKKFKLSSYSSNQTSSLDFLISDALRNMTRYSRPLPIKTDLYSCSECKIESNLYRILSCKHLICRKCLLSTECSSKCAICTIPYSKNNVEKFHK